MNRTAKYHFHMSLLFVNSVYRKASLSGVYTHFEIPTLSDFSVLCHESKKYLLELKESLLMMRDDHQ